MRRLLLLRHVSRHFEVGLHVLHPVLEIRLLLRVLGVADLVLKSLELKRRLFLMKVRIQQPLASVVEMIRSVRHHSFLHLETSQHNLHALGAVQGDLQILTKSSHFAQKRLQRLAVR